MADPHAEQKRQGAVAAAAALTVIYSTARTNVVTRAARGIRSALLLPHWRRNVAEVNEQQLKRIAGDTASSLSDRVSLPRMDHYLEDAAQGRATGWEERVQTLLAQIDRDALDFVREVQQAMDEVVMDAPDDARDLSESAVEFGSFEAEKANGRTTKTWHLGAGDNHRASHVAQDGMTIGIDDRFPNGLRYPHAPGPPSETVNCNCYLTFGG